MYINDMLAKNVVLVRYKNVAITDRREADSEYYSPRVEDLFDVDFTSEKTDSIPLSKDPVWKNLVEKFGRFGYDIGLPEDVTRIAKSLYVGNAFYWDFERWDEDHAPKELEIVTA